MSEPSKIQREILIRLKVLGINQFDPHSSDLQLIISGLSKAINASHLFYKIASPVAVIGVMTCVLLSIGLISNQSWLPQQGLAGLYIASVALLLIAVRLYLRIKKMENQLFLMKLLQQTINNQNNNNGYN